MNSQQYEELCRYFLAEKLNMKVEEIKNIDVPSLGRPGLPKYKHQIDLYWETESGIAKYLHIANAKWRDSAKVDQPEILLLHQIKQDVAAHKAMMLTNVGFTKGAIAVAKDKGISLHIVKPQFKIDLLPKQVRADIQAKINEIFLSSKQPLYLHEIVHKAFDFSEISSADQFSTGSLGSPSYQTKVVSGHETKVEAGYSGKAVTTASRDGGPITKSVGPSEKK